MSTRLETFIRFTTDSVGLERTIRLFQALVQILSSFALPFDLLLYTLTLSTSSPVPPSASATRLILATLNQRLGLARRFFRLFRSLEAFHAAQKIYARISSPAPSSAGQKRRPTWVHLEPWLDLLSRTFMGMYLLLEASTFPHALQVPGLAPWSAERERQLTIEGQRFWLFALVSGALYQALEILNVLAHTPVPATGAGFGGNGAAGNGSETESKEEAAVADADANNDLRKEQQRLRAIVGARKEQRRQWRREVAAKTSKLARGAMANALDTVLPGTVVGWIKVEPGTVAVAMLVTTILTSVDVWERCEREVLASK